MLSFSEKEKAILRIAQKNIPDSLTPYADMAKLCQVTEEEVISLLRHLKESGAIRRFGAMIRHHKTDWVHNAMVAWKVDPAELDSCGAIAASISTISHVYYRPCDDPSWPYTLYTMIHGREPGDCEKVIAKLMSISPLREHVVLHSLKELKKVSMTYF